MNRNHLSRRDFLRMGMLGTAGMALAACAPQVVEKTIEVTREVEVEVEKEVVVEQTVQVPVEAGREDMVFWPE